MTCLMITLIEEMENVVCIVVEARSTTQGIWECGCVSYEVEVEEEPRLGRLIASLLFTTPPNSTQLEAYMRGVTMMRTLLPDGCRVILIPRWDNVWKWMVRDFKANLEGSRYFQGLGDNGFAALSFPSALPDKWIFGLTVKRGLSKHLNLASIMVVGEEGVKERISVCDWVADGEDGGEGDQPEEGGQPE